MRDRCSLPVSQTPADLAHDRQAEEESLRATNERLHAQAMAAQASGQAPNPKAYTGVDRLRKQDFIDPSALAEVVKKVGEAHPPWILSPRARVSGD